MSESCHLVYVMALPQSETNGPGLHAGLASIQYMIVMGKSFQEHLSNLLKMFERLREAVLTLEPQMEVFYLGQVISRGGVSTDPAKMAHPPVGEISSTISQVGKVLHAFCSRFCYNCKTTPLSHGKNSSI